jgi:hypothetical protein
MLKIAASLITVTLAIAPWQLAHAAEPVLGTSGEVFKATTGPLAELNAQSGTAPSVPESGSSANPMPQALAVEKILPVSGEVQTYLVPGSEDLAVETPRLMIFEDASEILYLFWESQQQNGDQSLHVAALEGDQWLDVAPIEGSPLALRQDQRHTITSDSFDIRLENSDPIEVRRTILHLTWSEVRPAPGGGNERVQLYTPIIFAGGRYIGWNPVFVLNDFDPAEAVEGGETLANKLLTASDLRQGNDRHTVVATFTNPRTRRLLSLGIEILPLELSHLGDELHIQIINMGSVYYPENISFFADDLHIQIINMGSTYNPAFLEYLAAAVSDHINAVASSAPDLLTLAAELRDLAIDTGAALISNEFGQTVTGASTIIELDLSGLQIPESTGGTAPETLNEPSQILDLRLLSSLPAPETGDGATSLYASAQGDKVLVAWEDEETEVLHYRQNTREGWSEIRSLVLNENLSLGMARDLLRRKVE